MVQATRTTGTWTLPPGELDYRGHVYDNSSQETACKASICPRYEVGTLECGNSLPLSTARGTDVPAHLSPLPVFHMAKAAMNRRTPKAPRHLSPLSAFSTSAKAAMNRRTPKAPAYLSSLPAFSTSAKAAINRRTPNAPRTSRLSCVFHIGESGDESPHPKGAGAPFQALPAFSTSAKAAASQPFSGAY